MGDMSVPDEASDIHAEVFTTPLVSSVATGARHVTESTEKLEEIGEVCYFTACVTLQSH